MRSVRCRNAPSTGHGAFRSGTRALAACPRPYLLLVLLLVGCGFTPPNYSQLLLHEGGGASYAMNVPFWVFQSNFGNADASSINTSTRLNTPWSADFHYRLSRFHLSPSLYFLGAGMGMGYLHRDRAVISLTSGISAEPLRADYGIKWSQRIHGPLFATYGWNFAHRRFQKCSGPCLMLSDSPLGNYQHLSLGLVRSGFLLDLHADYVPGPGKGFSFGMTVQGFRPFRR